MFERERKREGKGKRNIHQLPLLRTLTRDRTCSLGMGPDLELNLQPCGGTQDHAPTKLPDQGHSIFLSSGKTTCGFRSGLYLSNDFNALWLTMNQGNF